MKSCFKIVFIVVQVKKTNNLLFKVTPQIILFLHHPKEYVVHTFVTDNASIPHFSITVDI